MAIVAHNSAEVNPWRPLLCAAQGAEGPQDSRYTALNVRRCQSDTSVNKPGRLSKAGNVYLRSTLYLPALSAVRHDPNAMAFYEALQKRGKKKIQALFSVMRKQLTGLWGLSQARGALQLMQAI